MLKLTNNIVITSILLICTILFFEFTNTDIWLQNHLYDFNINQWLVDRNDSLLRLLFYDGIKRVLILLIVVILTGSVLFRKSNVVQEYRTGLFIIVLSAILVPLVVGALKTITNIPCPYHLQHFGGVYPHITLLDSYPHDFHQASNVRCYPAAHASGGFALLSFVFLFKRKRNKIIAAISALVIGWSMGTYKMLIGDHFLSHTVVSMILAWLSVLIIAKCIYTFISYPENHPD